MTTAATARDDVLARIRGALGDDPSAPPVPRAYRSQGRYAAGSPELVLQLVDRLEDYRATVVRIGAEDDGSIGQAVFDALASREIGQAVTPSGTPREWTNWLADVVVDDGSLDGRGLERLPSVVTGSVVAIAETGTIVLDHGPGQGRRAITLVPDVHVCIVRADQVVADVPDAMPRLDPTRPLTWISGPSATSDIELDRVEGVHGPRVLHVIIVG